ncbi:MAG: carbamoyl-phosphate synthase large subunit, partial [Candidatus Micrarchaeota archaeon]|nr:carbamoyl-phosphate synthase large subunit [Candidatus Micrarchaeota archaeon]
VVVTPAQTLDNKEYQDMRTAAIKVAEAIDLIGECNVQFALDPKGNGFYIIETNPRMSRSSALASKATGYPLADVSAKLALGHKLHEIKNNVSKSTSAFFEPSLDYVTIKIPRWDLAKFDGVSESVGTEMKSIGEVMAIGRSMEEAFQKAVRMIDIGEPGIVGGAVYNSSMAKEEVIGMLKARKPYWFLYAAKGFKEGLTVRQIHDATLVDEFFLERIKAIVDAYEKRGKDAKGLDGMGFSSAQAGRSARKRICIKQIDTLAGEWPARTNYLYSTDKGSEDDIGAAKGKKLLVLGAGVFRIGVSVEFDYGAVALAESAKKHFNSVSMLNYNPETVSTDWDRVDRLYFDELTNATITAICEKEKFESVATFAAGQIGNNLSLALEKNGIKLLGTMGSNIDRAEDRNKFSALLERLGIRQPNWTTAASLQEIRSFIERYGFPVLVRPSYVLSGSAMKIANSVQELIEYTEKATRLSPAHPAIISSFIKDAVEAELDCGADGRNVIGVSMYHIEEAGVHSGDATIATPYIDHGSSSEMKEIALRLVNELEIRGPFNLQFIIDRSGANVIELNLRASRSMPFASKSVGANIIDYSVRGILGKYDWTGFNEPKHSSFAVKSAQFSWGQLKGAYPCLGPEMRSTGESASLGRSLESALVKSWLGVQPNRLPRSSVLIYGDKDRTLLKQVADILSESIAVSTLEEAPMHNHPTIDRNKALEMIHKNGIDLIITNNDMRETDYSIRRSAADLNIPLVLNARMGLQLARSLHAAIDCDELGEYWKTGRRKTYENQRI